MYKKLSTLLTVLAGITLAFAINAVSQTIADSAPVSKGSASMKPPSQTPTPTPTPVPTPIPDCFVGSGCLDGSFGTLGKVTTSLNFGTGQSRAYAVAVQADRKIVVAVDAYNYPAGTGKDAYAVRYDPDGSLDLTFGSGGVTRITYNGESPNAVVIQADGKIVVGGNTEAGGFGISRLNTDGTIDNTFGTNGHILSNYAGTEPAYLWSLAIDPANGSIVGCGGSSDRNSPGPNFSDTFALVRLTSSGAFDTSFNGSGKLSVPLYAGTPQTGGACHGVAITANGKIVGAGARPGYKVKNTITSQDFAVMQLNSNGTLDNSFGSGGVVFTDFFNFSDGAGSIALDAIGNILAAGSARTVNVSSTPQMALARFLPNGALDTSFGTGGKVTYGIAGHYLSFNGIVVQPDGKIIGTSYAQGSPSDDFLVARFNANGSLDTGFGPGGTGIVTTDYNGLADDAFGIAILPADPAIPGSGIRYVVAGATFGGTSRDVALARYLP